MSSRPKQQKYILRSKEKEVYKRGDVILWSTDINSNEEKYQNSLGLVWKVREKYVIIFWVPYNGDTYAVDLDDENLHKVIYIDRNKVANMLPDEWWTGRGIQDFVNEFYLTKN